jgi:hypothetical protein
MDFSNFVYYASVEEYAFGSRSLSGVYVGRNPDVAHVLKDILPIRRIFTGMLLSHRQFPQIN